MNTYSIKADGKTVAPIKAVDIFAACVVAKIQHPHARGIEVRPMPLRLPRIWNGPKVAA